MADSQAAPRQLVIVDKQHYPKKCLDQDWIDRQNQRRQDNILQRFNLTERTCFKLPFYHEETEPWAGIRENALRVQGTWGC